MSQFAVCKNRDRASAKRFPYLLDVQHDFLSSLATRMVIPLGLKTTSSLAEQERLILSFKIEEHEVLLMTPQMAGVTLSQLGEQVDDLGYCRDDIVGAMDFLLFGY